jgi:hypothetical protein
MYEEFDGRTRTKIVRGADGIARVLSHADRHVTTTAATPQLAANDYLSRYGHLLGLKQQHLNISPAALCRIRPAPPSTIASCGTSEKLPRCCDDLDPPGKGMDQRNRQ